MRPALWQPAEALTPAEQAIMRRIRRAKLLFDPRHTAVVHNLHVLQRLPDVVDVPQAA